MGATITTPTTTTRSTTSTTTTTVTSSLTSVTTTTSLSTQATSRPQRPEDILGQITLTDYVNNIVNAWQTFFTSILESTGVTGTASSKSGPGLALLVVFGVPLATAVLTFLGAGPMSVVIVAWVVPFASAFFLPGVITNRGDGTMSVGRALQWCVERTMGMLLGQ